MSTQSVLENIFEVQDYLRDSIKRLEDQNTMLLERNSKLNSEYESTLELLEKVEKDLNADIQRGADHCSELQSTITKQDKIIKEMNPK